MIARAAIIAWLVLCLPSALFSQAPAPTRILVSIGQDIGAPDDERLLYAERDAERMAKLLTELGDVAKSRSYLVTDASADKVRQVLTEVRGRAMELPDVVLIAYVSGHADEHGLRLGASHLPREELRALLQSIPARLRILIVDACTSGALIRDKGGKVVKAFAIDLESSQAIEGQVVIASTGPSEPAQEWEALGGALFTHHLLSALRGAADLDADGRVTLFEAYAYSYDRTLADSTRAHAGAQHPSHDLDVRGAGDLVLTRPGGRGSGLLLGAALSGRYVITDAMSGELTAELDKRQGRALRLALDPGRYLIRKPEGAFVRVGELTVLPSSVSALDESDLEQVPYTEVARRGAQPLHLWSIELASSLSSAALAGGVVTPRVGVGVGRELGPWALSAGVELGLESFRGASFAIDQRELWGFAESRLRMPLDWALPYLSLRGSFGVIQQSMVRDQERMIREVFEMDALPDRTGAAGQLLVGVGLELPFSRVLLRLEGSGGVTLSAVERVLSARPLAAGRLIGAYRF